MTEKWKEDCEGGFGALLTDLSKTFYCIPFDLTITKLEAYGFQMDAKTVTYDHLSNRNAESKNK